MWDNPANSSLEISLLTAERPAKPSPLQEEVTQLFDELRNPLLRYAFSLGLPAQDGDEVIQEVFLALFRHLRQGKSRQNLRGWLFRVTHNLALKHRRSQARSPMVAPDENFDRLDHSPNPEEALAASQQLDRIQAVVRALPEQDRCCLHLRAEGLRYREIAEVLGMSLGAVSLSLVRSLDRLRRAGGG